LLYKHGAPNLEMTIKGFVVQTVMTAYQNKKTKQVGYIILQVDQTMP